MAGYVVGTVVVAALITLGLVLSRALQRTSPPPAPATSALVGELGTVVITIPEAGAGEVAIAQPGGRLRVAAAADAPIPSGTTVVVVDVPSPQQVVVAESGF